ncbi:hypothetical protein PR048_005749 [Dryococelus australis]|uniref:Reverse transcriptase RNase H-like domain-containing protein n=1 Tax=Dryococelus australis TaxID=614101 RepID=A0ABQ9IA08_9NEOP|nr:hypothetical protein PR048_005749 [Dryococelus australis]
MLLVDPAYIAPTINFPVPKNVKGVMCFLEMLRYLSKIFPVYTAICVPVNNLNRKHVGFSGASSSKEVVRLCNMPFCTRSIAIGYNCELKPTEYASKTLSQVEKVYNVYEKEAFTYVFGVERIVAYLQHSEFDLMVDN